MTIDTKDMLNSILESISRISYIKPEEIPEIDLYMDQVTTFMESHLSSSRRHEGDKILTKTMINNYAKNNLLPPPVKKKYSKEHLLMLTFIYYLKNILCINDIQTLLDPISENYFSGDGSMDMTELYNEIMNLELKQIEPLAKDVTKNINLPAVLLSTQPKKNRIFSENSLSSVCSVLTCMLKNRLSKKL